MPRSESDTAGGFGSLTLSVHIFVSNMSNKTLGSLPRDDAIGAPFVFQVCDAIGGVRYTALADTGNCVLRGRVHPPLATFRAGHHYYCCAMSTCSQHVTIRPNSSVSSYSGAGIRLIGTNSCSLASLSRTGPSPLPTLRPISQGIPRHKNVLGTRPSLSTS